MLDDGVTRRFKDHIGIRKIPRLGLKINPIIHRLSPASVFEIPQDVYSVDLFPDTDHDLGDPTAIH